MQPNPVFCNCEMQMTLVIYVLDHRNGDDFFFYFCKKNVSQNENPIKF